MSTKVRVKKAPAPETAPAAAASSGEVLVQADAQRCTVCQQQLPHDPLAPGHVKVTLKQDVLLNGVRYVAGNTYELPEGAFHIWKYAAKTKE